MLRELRGVGRGVLLCAFVVLASGCATGWSSAQKAKLSSIAITQPAIAPSSYHKPDVSLAPGYSESIPAATGGGLIPALIGSAMDSHVTARQQSEFEQSSGFRFGQIQEKCSEFPAEELQNFVTQAMRRDAFFRARLSAEGRAKLSVSVTRHGLVRSRFSAQNDLRLCYGISGKLELRGDDGEVLLVQSIAAGSELCAEIAEFATKDGLIARARREACENLAFQIRYVLGKKLGVEVMARSAAPRAPTG